MLLAASLYYAPGNLSSIKEDHIQTLFEIEYFPASSSLFSVDRLRVLVTWPALVNEKPGLGGPAILIQRPARATEALTRNSSPQPA